MRWRYALLSSVFGSALAVIAGVSEPQEAVERFLKEAYPFEKAVDRQYAIRGQVQDVTDELGVGQLSSERVFSFPVKAAAPVSHALVAVDTQGAVWLVDDRESINRLFDSVPSDVEPAKTAQFLVDTFLRVVAFNGYRNDGYALGINVVNDASDIPGFSDKSLAEVIRPPQLVHDEGGYRFTAFSWARAGGAVSRHTVFISDNRVSDYQVETLATWTGAHGVMH